MGSAIATLIFVLLASVPNMFAQNDMVAKAMADEMARSKTQLRLAGMEKPYYIDYRVDDSTIISIKAVLGALASSNTAHFPTLNVQVRAGDYAFDNTNFLAVQSFGSRLGKVAEVPTLPLDDDYDQIRREIWLATDQAYKQAAGELGKTISPTESQVQNQPAGFYSTRTHFGGRAAPGGKVRPSGRRKAGPGCFRGVPQHSRHHRRGGHYCFSRSLHAVPKQRRYEFYPLKTYFLGPCASHNQGYGRQPCGRLVFGLRPQHGRNPIQ